MAAGGKKMVVVACAWLPSNVKFFKKVLKKN
jgi:hypothetical protein